jgi:hypothetical protein
LRGEFKTFQTFKRFKSFTGQGGRYRSGRYRKGRGLRMEDRGWRVGVEDGEWAETVP